MTREEKLAVLEVMLHSRLGDLREQSLIRQGKAMFHVSGMGHEALAVVGRLSGPEDWFCPYYRDRAMALARGKTNYELALDFFAKRESSSGGRQMPSHYSSKKLKIFSVPSPVAGNLLPACGVAWGLQLDGKQAAVIATVGDAATRQGDFYEAGSFAKERNLPLLFIVEDNGIGISSLTERITPWGLGLLKEESWVEIDGSDVEGTYAAVEKALAHIRGGNGPVFMWCRMARISSHSSADDHRKYLEPEAIAALAERDPILCLKDQLIAAGELTEEAYQELHTRIEKETRDAYVHALEADEPEASDIQEDVFGPPAKAPELPLDLGEKSRMVDAINGVFRSALEADAGTIFFGQDIADPKGGVFSLTKGLSTDFPGRVVNSPLAEATIIGVACGLAAYGKRPVFEVQFIDFILPGWNQLVTNLSTLRWRSRGEWSCPAVIYAPYGAYLPGGAIWHSQTNEGAIIHYPGLKVAIPSNPEDAAGLFWSAIHDGDPVVVLLPKHLFWKEHELPQLETVPLGQARIRKSGTDVTVVTWGNCVEVAEQAIAELEEDASVELIDLRSVMPWDRTTVRQSVRKTGRLIIVQEDNEHASAGQMIIASLCGDSDVWESLLAPPKLVAKPHVQIGYSNVYEYNSLPSAGRLRRAILDVLRTTSTREVTTAKPSSDGSASKMITQAFSGVEQEALAQTERREITVPLLGEGITSARLVEFSKQPGDEIKEDDGICELETDKAVFPVESPHSGKLVEWLVKEEEEVEVGQPLAVLECAATTTDPRRATPRTEVPESPPPPAPEQLPTEGGLAPHIVNQLKNVVATHMTVKAGWGNLRSVRAEAKEKLGREAPSPTTMLAWCIVRAIEKHPIFSCTINARDTLTTHQDFDFGLAVSLENDALDTAVMPKARNLEWPDFVRVYNGAVANVRARKPVSKARVPLILTSMGGFSVRSALPVVVPPAIATLFVGEAHLETLPGDDGPREQVELCLSFDHRWINGVAGAAFLSDVRTNMESFRLPVAVS